MTCLKYLRYRAIDNIIIHYIQVSIIYIYESVMIHKLQNEGKAHEERQVLANVLV